MSRSRPSHDYDDHDWKRREEEISYDMAEDSPTYAYSPSQPPRLSSSTARYFDDMLPPEPGYPGERISNVPIPARPHRHSYRHSGQSSYSGQSYSFGQSSVSGSPEHDFMPKAMGTPASWTGLRPAKAEPASPSFSDAPPTRTNRQLAHVASEQKRRESINAGFDDLRQIIPSSRGANDSKALVLKKAAWWILHLQEENVKLRAALEEGEVPDEPEPQGTNCPTCLQPVDPSRRPAPGALDRAYTHYSQAASQPITRHSPPTPSPPEPSTAPSSLYEREVPILHKPRRPSRIWEMDD